MNTLEGHRKLINLLPYHKVAENKHLKLGNPKNFVEFDTPDENEIQGIISIFKNYNIKATVGG
jgi:pyruvate formate lyase activating enzyme